MSCFAIGSFLLSYRFFTTSHFYFSRILGVKILRTAFSLISGKLIDKFSAMMLFPLHLIPFAIGLCVLAAFKHPAIAPIYLTLTGISMGLSSTVSTALLAEVYGTRNLGGVRALFSTIMVLSTALSPVLFGFLLDYGFNFTFISAGSVCPALLAIYVSSRLPSLVGRSKENGFISRYGIDGSHGNNMTQL